MGCASSKRVDADYSAVVYKPPPTSFALFDVSAVQEPWLTAKGEDDRDPSADDDDLKKQLPKTIVPHQLLEKIDAAELPPASWSEVSKALEDLKPTLGSTPVINSKQSKPLPPPQQQQPPPAELAGRRAVKDNMFILRDKESMNAAAGAPARWRPRDPFEGFPERRPPGPAGGGVVLYTTTLRGVRRTFEDCEAARRVVEAHAADAGLAVDERDVSLHGGFLKELRELVGEEEGAGAPVPPKLFVMGRYVGAGAKEIAELGDGGKLREMMRWAARRGEGGGKDGKGCGGCGGARFVPCWECGGSCKLPPPASGGEAERCGECNENGLALCPLCH